MSPSVSTPPKRADARRNYDQILRAAEIEVATHGAEASLEEIARRAGVGSATLHRHFPSRWALLQAVFHDRVEALCSRAHTLYETAGSDGALQEWLTEVAVFGATTRGLARSLMPDGDETALPADDSCEAMLVNAGGELLKQAQQSGAIRSDTSIVELLTLVSALSLATEGSNNAADAASRLLTLAMEGVKAPTK